LETKTRKIKNFFNSSITYGEDYLKQRKPNGKNTLGFDIFSVVLPNYDFEVFPVGNDYLRVSFSNILPITPPSFFSISNCTLFEETYAISIPEKNAESNNSTVMNISDVNIFY